MKKTTLLLLVIFFGIHIFFLAKLRFTAWPEMLSYPFLRDNGFLIYKDMIHPYPPVLTMGLSIVYSIFGYKLWVMKAVVLAMILANDVLIYLIVKKLTKTKKFAFLSLALYILLQPFLEGNMLWFDLAIVPPILLGTYFLLKFLEQPSHKATVVATGFFFAMAALVKQTAGVFLVLGGLWLLFKRAKMKDLIYLFIGPAVVGIPLLARLSQEKALTDFFNWTIIYPVTQWSKFPGYVQMGLTVPEVVVVLFLLAPLGLMLSKKIGFSKDKNLQLLLLFLLGGLVSVYPRFSFFHFQAALAFLVILAGYLAKKTKIGSLVLAFYSLLLLFAVVLPVARREWGKEARFFGQSDLRMAEIIKGKVSRDEKVFLLGLHSGLYSMAERLPPKRWTDNFGWYLETPGVQEEIISRWGNNPAKAVFWREPRPGNWFDLGTYQPQKITKWLEGNYTKEEEVEPGIWLWLWLKKN